MPPYGDSTTNVYRGDALRAWWLNEIINEPISIIEKMVLFWHNHFATQVGVIEDARMSYNHLVMLRTNALGNFKQLVSKVSKDPAMLIYLNGYLNTKNSPDENYGRELQELYTVGKDNAENYNEDDVKAAARVLTGWRVNNTTLEGFFMPGNHDLADKQFSEFYGNTSISGLPGTSGATEMDDLINMIFKKPEAAHLLCSKLYRYFVYYVIDEDIDVNFIWPLARLLIDSNFDIKPVLSAIFKSEHFYHQNFYGCYIKTPLDIIAGSFKMFNGSIPMHWSTNQRYALYHSLILYCKKLGMHPGDPPGAAGWPAFRQSPAYYQLWINSTTYPLRQQFTIMLAGAGYYFGNGDVVAINTIEFARQFASAADPDAFVAELQQLLLGVQPGTQTMKRLKNKLQSGQMDDSYWTTAWLQYIGSPTDENTAIVSSRINALINEFLLLPEYQLC